MVPALARLAAPLTTQRTAFNRRPTLDAGQWLSADGLKMVVAYMKNWTYRRPFTSAVRTSLAANQGPSLPPEENECVIGGDAISRCLDGLTCTHLSRYSITFSIPPHPITPSLFLCKFGLITRPIFSKTGSSLRSLPQTIVALPVVAV